MRETYIDLTCELAYAQIMYSVPIKLRGSTRLATISDYKIIVYLSSEVDLSKLCLLVDPIRRMGRAWPVTSSPIHTDLQTKS